MTRSPSSTSSCTSTCGAARGGFFSSEIVEHTRGFVDMRIGGKNAAELFADEPGGHRFQRVPENEKRGRVHTSTITVSVLPEPTEVQVTLDERDLDIKYCLGSGNGGQNKQKTSSACQITHVPTGTHVRCESARSAHENKDTAIVVLRARLWQIQHAQVTGARDDERRRQVGSGMRGCKTWSIDVPEDRVTHHASGRRWRYAKEYARGNY